MRSWINQIFSRRKKAAGTSVIRNRACRMHLEVLEDRCVPTVFVVTNNLDAGAGSLRQAILDSNATPGQDTILFNVGSGFQAISLKSALPTITDTVTIDATTQPGYAGTPDILVDGGSSGATNGLLFGAGSNGSTLKGLALAHFTFGAQLASNNNTFTSDEFVYNAGGVYINNSQSNTIGGTSSSGNLLSLNTFGLIIGGGAASNNVVAGNLIGTDFTGAKALGNSQDGIQISSGASGNTIGGSTSGTANIISGNGANGIQLISNGSLQGNTVIGNFIGVNKSGTAALQNGNDGILINASAFNSIGGSTAGFGNLISGNAVNGIDIQQSPSSNNTVQGNFIGTNAAGNAAIGNRAAGISIGVGSPHDNTIGGFNAPRGIVPTSPDIQPRNIISGNGLFGVSIADAGTHGNVVQGNFIGTDVTGAFAVGNVYDGVLISNGAANNTIGGNFSSMDQGVGNLISGNGRNGVTIIDSTTTLDKIQGNFIGLNANGTAAIANGSDGVLINGGANGNTIGGINTPANQVTNIISGNGLFGVEISDSGTTLNQVQGNYIGTNAGGTSPVGNVFGVFIHNQATNNTIGATATGAGNSIGGNTYGVVISGSGVTGNQVLGNTIGTNAILSSTNIGNTQDGVNIQAGATGNLIGGTTVGSLNVISTNGHNGITINGAGTSNNVVQGNFIGTNFTGTGIQGNVNAGVAINAGATNNLIGGSALARNVISGNGVSGVDISDSGTTLNSIQSNDIGTNAPGNDQQTVSIFGSPTGGTFTLTLNGQTTAPIAFNASVGTIQTALANLSNIGAGNVLVTGGPLPNTPFVVTFTGLLANVPVNQLTATSSLTPPGSTSISVNHTHIGGQVTSSVHNGIGVLVENSATANNIGGTTTGSGNVISGNTTAGVQLQGTGTSSNLVQGNDIGTDSTGTVAIGNGTDGVILLNGAGGGKAPNTIGGIGHNAGNVIAGNGMSGVLIHAASNNLIEGDFIGNSAPANDVQTLSMVGAPTSGSFTLTFGNQTTGPIAFNATAAQIAAALSALPNVGVGNVAASGGPINLTPVIITFQGNLQAQAVPFLAANRGTLNNGGNIQVSHTTQGSANVAVPNQLDGVTIQAGATGNTVGGDLRFGTRNYISGNIRAGVTVQDPTSINNVVEGNLIGTNAAVNDVQTVTIFGSPSGGSFTLSGSAPAGSFTTGNIPFNVTAAQLASILNGVIPGANPGDVIGEGGPLPGTPITLTFEGALANQSVSLSVNSNNLTGGTSPTPVVAHTVIGHVATGALANLDGVDVVNTSNTTIGGTLFGQQTNLISGNNRMGVLISGAAATSNLVQSNVIGTLQDLSTPLGNGSHGVFITDNASNNTVGGLNSAFGVGGLLNTGDSNLIANSGGNGVLIGSDPGNGFNNLAGIGNAIIGGNIIFNSGLNSTASSGGLGINLGNNSSSPTLPDGLGHVGPNHYQNIASFNDEAHQIIPTPYGSAEANYSNTTIVSVTVDGTVTSSPNSTLRIEFYSISAPSTANPSGFGEGPTLWQISPNVYWVTVTTDAQGRAAFSQVTGAPLNLGDQITAVVTNLTTNDTSEFSFATTVFKDKS